MSAALDVVRETAAERADSELRFREALRAAKEVHSWREVAAAARMSIAGVRYLVLELNDERRSAQ